MIMKLSRAASLLSALLLVSVLALALAAPALAADIRGGDTIVIAADEVIDDDLFVSGNRVEVNGTAGIIRMVSGG